MADPSQKRFTHAVCLGCFKRLRPGARPYRMVNPPPNKCCWCNARTDEGIYMREDPEKVPCQGLHREL